MSGFIILTTEPSDIDFTVDYQQPISQSVFNNIFDDTIADKTMSDGFLNGLFAYMNTDIPLRRQLRSTVQAKDNNTAAYRFQITDTVPIKTGLYNMASGNATTFSVVATEWNSGGYLRLIFTSTPAISTVKFCIRVLMQ